jgi:hypothetical protein
MAKSYHSPTPVHLESVVRDIKRVHCGGYNCILETSTVFLRYHNDNSARILWSWVP